MNYSFYFCL